MMMMMMICHRRRLFSYWCSFSCICGGSCCFSTRSVASCTALQVIATPELASRATSTDVGSAHKWGCLPNGVWENSHGLTWTTTQSTVLVDGENEGSHSGLGEKHAIKSILFHLPTWGLFSWEWSNKYRNWICVSFGKWQLICMSKSIPFLALWRMSMFCSVLQVYTDTCTNISLAVRQLSFRYFAWRGSRGRWSIQSDPY